MSNGKYLASLPDEFFLNALDPPPKSNQEYSDILGIPRQSLEEELKVRRPEIYQKLERAKLQYRLEQTEARERSDGEESPRVKQVRERAEADKQVKDVSTLVGQKIRALEERNKNLREQNKDLQDQVYNQRQLKDEIVAASTEPLSKPKWNVKRSNGKKDKRSVLLPIFDMQTGTKIIPDDTVGDLGEFNAAILKDRARRYVETVAKVIHTQSSNFQINHIVFAIGGDMVEGDEIFEEQGWQLEMPAPDQVILARDLLTWIIDGIMSVGAEVGAKQASVICVGGNHGRRGKKRGGRHKRDNFDILTYWLLEEKLKNYPIFNFVVKPAGNVAFDILGNEFAMLHGDEIRGWGGIPFYGITRHDAKMVRTLNHAPQYVLAGHHHQQAQIPVGYGEWLMSGNWVGATNMSGGVGSNTPKQAMFMVDPDHGVLDRVPILLDDVIMPQPTVHKTS